jgi:hypothetical protein
MFLHLAFTCKHIFFSGSFIILYILFWGSCTCCQVSDPELSVTHGWNIACEAPQGRPLQRLKTSTEPNVSNPSIPSKGIFSQISEVRGVALAPGECPTGARFFIVRPEAGLNAYKK